MDFRGQPEIERNYGLSGTEPVINQECMNVHAKEDVTDVKLSGTAIMMIIITASNILFGAVFFIIWTKFTDYLS